MPDGGPSNQEILEAINAYATSTDSRFNDLKFSIDHVRAAMLTKSEFQSILDERLFDLKSDLALLIRKEDRKLVALINELLKQKILSPESAKQILALEPYPQLA